MKVFFLFPVILVLFFSAAIRAQEPADAPRTDAPQDDRPKLMAELGLAPEQIREIRRLNQERRPKMQEAQRRLGESMRNLDMAIYSDTVSDADFEVRLREHQEAQAGVARLRFEGELAMRKVLTPDQLVRFRQLRRQFNAAREKLQRERRMEQRQQRQRQPELRPFDGPRPPATRPLRRPGL